MLNRLALLPVLLVTLGSGCGLRKLPYGPDGSILPTGGTGGGGGATAGTSGNAGTGGSASGGTGGEIVVVDASVERVSYDSAPDSPICSGGSDCIPANPCHEGETACNGSGVATCTDTQRSQANGTVCGTDRVCNAGTCTACAAGMDCPVPGKPCRTGSIVCTTGAPVCTETDNKPNGSSCGSGMVCQGGQCATCQNDAPCTPANPCHQGGLACTTGTPVCTDKGTFLTAGAACGTDRVCNTAGICNDCATGATCAVAGMPCRTGTTACNTGAPTCVQSGNAPNGTTCGTNQVCTSGSCVSCTAALPCVPANPCHAGFTSCSPVISCADTGTMLTNGAVCGADRVCSNGTCVSCTAGASCQPANACRTGATSCVTGASVCAETGNRPNGTPCGTNEVCSNGNCVGCTGGTACTPINPCHNGSLSCSTGAATCTDLGTSVNPGTPCGSNLVCNGGTCVSCTAGVACTHANSCKLGVTSCMTGTSMCVDAGNKPMGTPCGSGQTCSNGVKTTAALCNASGVCSTMTVTCPGGACNPTNTDCSACANGETMCPGGCRNLSSDPGNCGTCGYRCSDPPLPGSGSGVCGGGQCGISCSENFLRCENSNYCERRRWDFEDGTTGGFSILRTDYPMAVTTIGASSSQAHDSRYALAIGIKVEGKQRGFEVGLLMCGDGRGYIPAKGQRVSAWFFLEPSSATIPQPDKSAYFGEHLYTENRNGGTVVPLPVLGKWFQVTSSIEELGQQLFQIAVEGNFGPEPGGFPIPIPGGEWSGTVYIDDITIAIE